MTTVDHHRVIEEKGWTYIVGPSLKRRDGPWRYRWEAQEECDRLNSQIQERRMPTITLQQPVETQAKTLKLYLNVRDEFTATLLDQDDAEIFHQDDGYVPEFMPGDHYGDYVILDIDLDTGKILNWTAPTAEQLQNWIAASED